MLGYPTRIVRVTALRGSRRLLPRNRTTTFRRPLLPSRRLLVNVTRMRYVHDDDSVSRRVDSVLPAAVLNCAETRPPLHADVPTPAGRWTCPLTVKRYGARRLRVGVTRAVIPRIATRGSAVGTIFVGAIAGGGGGGVLAGGVVVPPPAGAAGSCDMNA